MCAATVDKHHFDGLYLICLNSVHFMHSLKREALPTDMIRCSIKKNAHTREREREKKPASEKGKHTVNDNIRGVWVIYKINE